MRRPSKEGDAPATRHYKTHYRSLATPYRRPPLFLTPTRSSMTHASSASVKPPKKPLMVPALMQSPVSKPLAAPRTPQTEFNLCVKTNLPSFANLKSILCCCGPFFLKDPAEIAAGMHFAAPDRFLVQQCPRRW
ncbi:hypothetical protein SI65_09301 [Aspergillus cristatus]|uniref:Uncharacterized protein n=1 Tax=Aspergillus cristatus TaxID=573508 RepID=A0A1E3B328_ASPCR|nr:hypothetical protein SI65_09301 [Aspergillus cristatus]